jgi:hypothetical protein
MKASPAGLWLPASSSIVAPAATDDALAIEDAVLVTVLPVTAGGRKTPSTARSKPPRDPGLNVNNTEAKKQKRIVAALTPHAYPRNA